MIAYDITNNGRRRKIALLLEGAGQRVQYSVFLADLTSGEVSHLRRQVLTAIDPTEDSVRYYPLCKPCAASIRTDGTGELYDNDGHMIV